MKKKSRVIIRIIIIFLCAGLGYQAYRMAAQYIYENAILKQIIACLEADSRVAEVLVTGVNYNEVDKKTYTTIKFLEYDSKGKPLKPKYFTFSGNIIQFQSLVVRFDDIHIRAGDQLKGKSAYLFWKVFVLNGEKTQEYEIAKINQVPRGYQLGERYNPVEAKFWSRFWDYALDSKKAKLKGIKNAQIEAPGTMFVPGNLYTIKIEHDGGLRIDASPLSKILLGEQIPL
ncbi:MAG: hypothetical protein KAR31_05085 [Candidatus Omnitrophica bacterium]|nr:hypothetical protein [Candidatus Omnitrophota bacterium]